MIKINLVLNDADEKKARKYKAKRTWREVIIGEKHGKNKRRTN